MFNKKIYKLALLFLFIFSSCHSDEVKEPLVIQSLAFSKISFINEDPENAYIGSKIAIDIINENEELQDHIFLAMYMHIIACDSAERYDERDIVLNTLNSLQIEICTNYDNIHSEPKQLEYFSTYNELISLTKFCSNDSTRESLIEICNKIFFNTFDQVVEENLTINTRGRIFGKSLDEWLERIEQGVDKVNQVLDVADKCYELWARLKEFYSKL